MVEIDISRYLVSFRPVRYGTIYGRIRYLIREKSGITYSINCNFSRTRIDSYNSFLKEKALTFPNVIILIRSVFSKNKNHYYYNMFLEKSFCDNSFK